MNYQLLSPLIRHLLTIAGGYFAAKYGVDQQDIDALVSGATVAAGLGWSYYEKRTQSKQ